MVEVNLWRHILRRRKKRRGRKALVIIALLCLAAFYLVRDSSENLSLTEYSVSDADLPQSFAGFKIVQLSDLHGADFGTELADTVREQNPDIIALTGDFITTEEDLPAVESLVSELSSICDVYFISGNHDFGSGKIQELSNILSRHGVKYLKNEYVELERGNDKIILAGVEDPNSWADLKSPDEFTAKLNAAYPDTYTVLLGHRNYWMTEYPELPVDLILCGHAHGGIIRIPGVGGILSTDRTLFPDYDAGMYENDSYTMIVSRGLGNSISVPRIFNRPEIVSIVLN